MVSLALRTCGFQVRTLGERSRERDRHQGKVLSSGQVHAPIGSDRVRKLGRQLEEQGAARTSLQSRVQKEEHQGLNTDSSCSHNDRHLSLLQTAWKGHSCIDLFSSLFTNVCI